MAAILEHPTTQQCEAAPALTTVAVDSVPAACSPLSSAPPPTPGCGGDALPAGFAWLEDEPSFDPAVHLQLERPSSVVSLSSLGYAAHEVSQRPSPLAATSMFRFLSDEGVRVARELVARLAPHAVSSPRIPLVLRGGTFRSRWLRDLMSCKEVRLFLSDLCGTDIDVHPMRIHGMHANLTPPRRSAASATPNVDAWHVDTTPFVYVLYLEDPTSYTGGKFQYFNGTREEGRRLLRDTGTVPAARIVSPAVPAAGYAIFQQGCMVFHRATAVRSGQRTSLVQSYHERAATCELEACTRLAQTYNSIDPLHVLLPEWAYARTWKAARRLEHVLCAHSSSAAVALHARFDRMRFPYTADRERLAAMLVSSLRDFHTIMPQQSETLREQMLSIFMELQNAANDILTLERSSMEFY